MNDAIGPVTHDDVMQHKHNVHAANVVRAATQRELESEMRGLLMAARMHGFKLELMSDGTVKAHDEREVQT